MSTSIEVYDMHNPIPNILEGIKKKTLFLLVLIESNDKVILKFNLPHRCSYHNSNESIRNHLWQNKICRAWRVLVFQMERFVIDRVSFLLMFVILFLFRQTLFATNLIKDVYVCVCVFVCYQLANLSHRWIEKNGCYVRFFIPKTHKNQFPLMMVFVIRNFWLEIVQKPEVKWLI